MMLSQGTTLLPRFCRAVVIGVDYLLCTKSNGWLVMEQQDELSCREILALKEILLTGRTTDRRLSVQLLNDDLIINSSNRHLRLSTKGRRMLVRGSPSLWSLAS